MKRKYKIKLININKKQMQLNFKLKKMKKL